MEINIAHKSIVVRLYVHLAFITVEYRDIDKIAKL